MSSHINILKKLNVHVSRVQGHLRDAFVGYRCKVKVRRILSELDSAAVPGFVVGRAKANEIASFLGQFRPKYRDWRWHTAYARVNGDFAVNYIPEDLFYTVIEPRMNPRDRIAKYRDKNFYEKLRLGPGPKTIARLVRGRLLCSSFRSVSIENLELPREGAIVVKPAVDSGRGKGFEIIEGAGLREALQVTLRERSTGPDLVIQEAVRQAVELQVLNPSSLNTFRILTARVNGRIDVLSTVVRIGRAGARVDSHSMGALACGVDGGKLRGFAINYFGVPTLAHPDSGLTFAGHAVPSGEAERLSVRLHEELPDLDLVSWDIAVDEERRPVFIECNLSFQGLNLHQFCNGPVFGGVSWGEYGF